MNNFARTAYMVFLTWKAEIAVGDSYIRGVYCDTPAPLPFKYDRHETFGSFWEWLFQCAVNRE